MGKTAVCGADALDVDIRQRRFTVDGQTVAEGDVISIDGSTGRIYLGEIPVQPSPVVQYFEGTVAPESDPLVHAVHRLITIADHARGLRVRTNADTPEDAARARRFGAEGIGLCRTEHMFLGDRRELVERLILAETKEQQQAALDALLPLQRGDFVEIFEAMDGLPVTIRLLDPPLHEFLPPLADLAVKVALAEERGEDPGRDATLLEAVHRMHEQNPMLGLRGVRLGVVIPGLFAMQVRAIAEAAAQVRAAGGDPRAEIMVPLVGAVQELETVRAEAERVLAEVTRQTGVDVTAGSGTLIGTMIEVPRAALTADEIARYADFFSFGTNDLTQATFSFSREDAENKFLPMYNESGILQDNPFEVLDIQGVGQLIEMTVQSGRAVREDLKIGICGEQGGHPETIRFCHHVGLNYVSCSAPRVPVARLAAAAAKLRARDFVGVIRPAA